MSILKKLFGGGEKAAQAEKAEEYKGFRIFPDPISEGAVYRISARVEKDFGEDTRVHTLIRADTLNDRYMAVAASAGKARQLIDQMGDQLFD